MDFFPFSLFTIVESVMCEMFKYNVPITVWLSFLFFYIKNIVVTWSSQVSKSVF